MSAYGSAYYRYYVHYHALTYLKQEHQAKNFPFEAYAKAVVSRKSNKLNSQRGRNKKRKYLQSINAVLGRETGTKNFDADAILNQRQIIEDALSKKLANNITLNRVSGEAQKIIQKGSLNEENVHVNNANPNLQKIAISEKRIKSILAEAYNIRRKIENIAKASTLNTEPPELKELQEVITVLEKELKNVRTLCTIDETGKKIYEKNFAALHGVDMKWVLLPTESDNWLTNVNKLLQQYQSSFKAANDIQGAYFEQVLASAGRVCVGKTEKSLYQGINRTIGADKQNIDFSIDGMPYSVWESTFLGKDLANSHIRNGVTVVTKEKYSQGKVDVEVWLSDKEQRQGLKPVRISAKSYSQINHFSAVSGTSLWTFLQDENDYFIKAYLNTMVKREAIAEKRWYGSEQIENNSIKTLNRQKHHAVAAMKLISAYKALTGDVLGRLGAQLFVVNDVKKQKVYLVEMSDIFQYVLTQISQSRSSIDYFFDFKNTLNEAWTYENKWAITEDMRLASVIQQAHEHKLTVIFQNAKDILQNPSIAMSIDKTGKIT